MSYQKKIIEQVKNDLSLIDEYALTERLFSGKYKELFKFFKTVYDRGLEVDETIVKDENMDIWADYADLDDAITANAEYYITAHRESINRERIKLLSYELSDAYNKKEDINEVMNILHKAESDILEEGPGELIEVKNEVHNTIKQIEKIYNSDGNLTGVPSGIESLDRYTAGFQNGELILIGARPSVGKTAFFLSVQSELEKANIPTGFFSLEMGKDAIMMRKIAIETQINTQSIRTGKLFESDFNSMTEAASKMAFSKSVLDCSSRLHISKLKGIARKMVKKGVKMIGIDYFSQIDNYIKGVPTHEWKSKISGELKRLSLELGIPIVVLCQLRRDAEGKEPVLSDLRDTGSLEQDADLVLFLHRERGAGKGKVIIAKQRNGPIGTIDICFDCRYSYFYERKEDEIS